MVHHVLLIICFDSNIIVPLNLITVKSIILVYALMILHVAYGKHFPLKANDQEFVNLEITIRGYNENDKDVEVKLKLFAIRK